MTNTTSSRAGVGTPTVFAIPFPIVRIGNRKGARSIHSILQRILLKPCSWNTIGRFVAAFQYPEYILELVYMFSTHIAMGFVCHATVYKKHGAIAKCLTIVGVYDSLSFRNPLPIPNRSCFALRFGTRSNRLRRSLSFGCIPSPSYQQIC